VSDPTVEPFLPQHVSTSDLAPWCEIFCEGQSELSGSSRQPAAVAERLLAADTTAVLRWTARSGDGAPLGGVAELLRQPHDPRIGFLRLFVAPSARRLGLGSALLERAMREARTAGVDRIQGTVLAGPPGEPFADTRPNLRVLLRLERQEQRLDQEAVLRRCRTLTVCPDSRYRLTHWRGAAPARLITSFGRVMGHVLDAPGADLQLAPRAWDAAAVRDWEARMTTDGQRLMVCAAVHLPSGDAVAATVTTVPSGGGAVADQHDTAVLPEHRRHGLARWIKAEQTLLLHRLFPGVRAVAVTLNQQNLPMVGVNQSVGYRRVRERLLVEAALHS
jgi:GNAT superfamily N-acetyltransferase